MSLTAKIKKLALSSEMDYVGVASIDRFRNAPEGWRPSDLLRNCRSVVVMGVEIGKGVRRANQQAYSGLRHSIYVYMMFGYVALNDRLNLAALRTTRLLEREGCTSMPIPASAPSDPQMVRGAFSHRHAAVAAGLGEFGWNTLLVTPQAGPRVRLVSVLTEAELTPDPMYSGRKICDRKRCKVCVSICPTNAISENEGVKIKIGDRAFEYAKLHRIRCRYGTHGLIRGALGREDIQMPDDPQPEDYLKALSRVSPWQKMERLASMCGRCVINCPIPRV